MPSKVRIISKRDDSFDHFIESLVNEDGFGAERTYFGITTQERANEVRNKLKTAGRHHEVSVKAYWNECGGCPEGGPECRFHVLFTAYEPDKAKAYMATKAQVASKRIR
jgi:hypothetical protein